MRRICFTVVLFLFLLVPAAAQNDDTLKSSTFDTTDFPQWAKDMRRWDIIAFGSFPFTMLLSMTAMDTYRWNNANGMNFSEEGRRYAPWPLKTAGAIEMTTEEFERTLIIAASLSAAVAFTDLIIVKIKRQKERRRIESRPTGSIIINRSPYQEPEETDKSADDPE
ncbi:MAG: hypothetical protein LBH44_05720 [Treponema sp.]|jgi:hypothetical protein|nr:hypothetical protein [Treponema sp.]